MITLKGNAKSNQHIYKILSIKGRAMMYMSGEGKALKQVYAWEAKNQWGKPPTSSKLRLRVSYYFSTHIRRDIDNYTKLWLDALSGIVWEDDVQVVSLYLEKKYDKENPRIEISVTEI